MSWNPEAWGGRSCGSMFARKDPTLVAVVEEANVPPIVTCRFCGAHDCDVCTPHKPEPVRSEHLPWEQSQLGLTRRLWRTARDTSREPQRIFTMLPDGSLLAALSFALLCETVAVVSLVTLVAALSLLAAPTFAVGVIFDLSIAVSIGIVVSMLVGTMLFMHCLWGLALEFGALLTGEQPQWRLGLRFGLYACGWDFVTSPIGFVCGAREAGPRYAWALVKLAVKAPRVAMSAYCKSRRQWSETVQRRALIASYGLLGSAMLVFSVGLLVALLWGWSAPILDVLRWLMTG